MLDDTIFGLLSVVASQGYRPRRGQYPL